MLAQENSVMFRLPKRDSEEQRKAMAELGPKAIDSAFRQAIRVAWMSLPDSKRTPDEVERALREFFDKAMQNLRNDFNMP
jgi:hypothetical protein